MSTRYPKTAWAAAAVVTMLLAACSGGGGGGSTDNSGGGTITFAGETQSKAYWDVLIGMFEKANPGTKVQVSYTPNDQYPQLMQTRFQSGNAADVFAVTPGSGGGLESVSLARGGRLEPLGGSAWLKEMPEALKPLVTVDGKVYVLPEAIAPYFAAYNPDLFKQAGVEVPTTFNELLTVCGKLKDAGYIPIALAGASFQNVNITIQTLAASLVDGPDPDWAKKRADGQTTFADSPEWKQVVDRFQQMIKAGCYAKDAAGVSSPVHAQQFGSGKAAMYVMPAQGLAIVAQNSKPGLKISTFPIPGDSADQTWIPSSAGIGVVINKNAKNMAGAKKFVDFLGSKEGRLAYAKNSGGIAWAAGPDGKDVIPETLEPLRKTIDAHGVNPGYTLWPGAAIAQQLATSSQGLLTGQLTPDEVLKATDKKWDETAKK